MIGIIIIAVAAIFLVGIYYAWRAGSRIEEYFQFRMNLLVWVLDESDDYVSLARMVWLDAWDFNEGYDAWKWNTPVESCLDTQPEGYKVSILTWRAKGNNAKKFLNALGDIIDG